MRSLAEKLPAELTIAKIDSEKYRITKQPPIILRPPSPVVPPFELKEPIEIQVPSR